MKDSRTKHRVIRHGATDILSPLKPFGRTALLVVALAGCDRGLREDELARAGDFRLQVEEAARMVAPVSDLPNDGTLVQTVVDFWADYVLLGWAVNQEGEVARLDLTHVLAAQVSMERIQRLRDSVIQVEEVSQEDLREMFEQDRPGEQVRASHVLLRFPDGATSAQRDSVRVLAEQIRDRARAGADFATLAREHSADAGSAVVGGDLGFFERGQMVPTFEDVAFALQPGRVSDLVPSDFGLHIIRVAERRMPTFEEVETEYRAEVNQRSMAQAESIFLGQVEGPANVLIREGALQRMRDVAAALEGVQVADEAADSLTTFQGGAFTVGEFHTFLLAQPRQLLEQVDLATDEQLDGFLRQLTRDKLLVREAEKRQITIRPEEITAFEADLRLQYARAAEVLGIASVQADEVESLEEAVDRTVKALMARLVRGEQEVVPLGGLANPLRDLYGVEVSETAIPQMIARVQALRAEGFAGDPPVGDTASAIGTAPATVAPPAAAPAADSAATPGAGGNE